MIRRVSAAAASTALRPLSLLHQISTVHVQPIVTTPSRAAPLNRSFSFLTHNRSRMARRIPPVRPDNYSDSDSEPEREEEVAPDGAEEKGDEEPREVRGWMIELNYGDEDDDEHPATEEQEKENK
jgi:hypothetical protein